MLKHVKARYRQSQAMLQRAEKVIPLGSQTFSKSRIQFPEGAAPLFLERGQGGRVWDVDGNEYVDMINGLCAVSLGYCDPDVDEAIREQLGRGITFSLATRLESVLAERLVETIPCAEAIRFGKNGSDATLGCVRVARAAAVAALALDDDPLLGLVLLDEAGLALVLGADRADLDLDDAAELVAVDLL